MARRIAFTTGIPTLSGMGVFIAPKTLLPHSIERLGVKAFTDMKRGLDN